ncbi:MAG: efflux RND transporter permease subunit, partial [Deltaproteobacteria bacterium]
CALVVLGAVSYFGIGVDLYPKVDFPIVSISTTLNGASPEIMDVDVTDKIEEAVNTINGVKKITSTSYEGVSNVVVEFELDRDIDLAFQDVREKVSSARKKLPTDVDEPVIRKMDTDSSPILWLNLSGNRSVGELSTYADETLREQLEKIEGVGAINTAGLRLRQVRIWLDQTKMRAYGITTQDIITTLGRENVEIPGGRIESSNKEYDIKIKGELPNVRDFSNLIVAYSKGAPIRLSSLGRVDDGLAEERTMARYNGVPAVGLGIQKQSGTNTVEVVERVKKELKKITPKLPPGVSINIVFDQSTFIVRSINEVQNHLIIGGILAIFAVFIFLRDIRITLISALALPISVIATFTLFKIFNFTFNNMTMLALTLSVGILIDDAIIVIENIHRNIEEGMSPREASIFGTSEIGMAVMATTLAIVVIFLPVAFMKGIIGRFFLQFALTVVFAVLVSLLVSFTLTPMMASIFLKERNKDANIKKNIFHKLGNRIETYYNRIERFYKAILVYALRHRALILVGALLIFIGSMFTTKFIGKEFVPPEDWGQFIVRMEAPIDYSFNKANDLFKNGEAL